MYRCIYDAYEIVAIKKLEEIALFINKYDADVINKVYPKFYAERFTSISMLKLAIADARKNKSDFIDKTTLFEEYQLAVNQTIIIANEVALHIEILSKERKKEIWKNLTYIVVGALLTIVIEQFISKLF